jgi:hypothetical protein
MNDTLVTVATFWNPMEANLVRNRLEAAGLQAFLESAESVNMAWYLTNAFGGIKLQVGEEDAETALAILAEEASSGPSPSDHPGEPLSSPTEVEPSDGRRAEHAAAAIGRW